MNFKDKFKYYAVATESSYYIKKGTYEEIKTNELEETLKTRKFKFSFTDNMHFDYDVLSCDIIKATIHYEFI